MGSMRHRAIGAAALALLSGCAQEEIGEARYGHDQCQRVALVDAVTGEAIRGAEDFALDPAHGRLFFSAYDRRAVEKAARKNASVLPNGGIYSIAIDSVFDGEVNTITVAPLAAPGDFAGGLHPHGISYDRENHELVFINRTYQRINRKWVMTPRLQRIGANGEIFVGAPSAAPCAANDVLVTNQQTFTSFDHGFCGWRAGFEDIFNLKRSGLALNGVANIFDRAGFANGLARSASGDIILSATRENALVLFKELSGAVEEKARIDLPGGPDNLSVAFDGGIIAATHPSLWRLGLNRKFGLGKAPSRIVKVDADKGDVENLFDDRSGKLFSAATVAVETKDGLVAGSVTDAGMLVCRGGS